MTSDPDNPPEEIVEEMSRIESKLAVEYEYHRNQAEHDMGDAEQNEDETDEIADSRITEHVARVDRYGTQKIDREECLVLSLQTVDGRAFKYIPWPEDPTDETEELVRLCAYLDIPIDQIGDLQGEYVPLCRDVRGDTVIHIPPIPTTGNLLRYRIGRFLRKKNILTWYDAVHAARRKYAEEQAREEGDMTTVRGSITDALDEAESEISPEDVDVRYPGRINRNLLETIGGLGILAVASLWLITDLPWAIDLLSKVASVLVAIAVFLAVSLFSYRVGGMVRDRLFPRAN